MTPSHERRTTLAARYGPLVLTLALAPAAVVLAHAVLVESSPAQDEVLKAPATRAVLRFNARIEKAVTRVTLVDGDGHAVKMPRIPADPDGPPDRLVVPLPPLKPGAYRLEYRVLAADGHSTPGLIRFTVSPPAATGPSKGGGAAK